MLSDYVTIAYTIKHQKKNKGFILNTPIAMNISGNCKPMLSKTGKKGPHKILGGFATAFKTISFIVS